MCSSWRFVGEGPTGSNSLALLRRSSVGGPSSRLHEATEKKRESRKSGFFNLIKSRTSRSEKSHGAAAVAPPPPSPAAPAPSCSTPCISPVAEEATPTPPQKELRLEHADAGTENAPAAGEAAEEKEVRQDEAGEQEKNTHVRLVGVPVMGLDLLAEMKARQEKMAVKKVRCYWF